VKTLGFITLSITRSAFDGLVLLSLWGWFIVPLGVRPIHYWHALGLDLCLSFASFTVISSVLARTPDVKQSDGHKLATSVAKWLASIIVLGLGALMHWLMVRP
jgi:hypothetical protein